MFIKELTLNMDYLQNKIKSLDKDDSKLRKDFLDFAKQLLSGITYYKSISADIQEKKEGTFLEQLAVVQNELDLIVNELIPPMNNLSKTQNFGNS